jgi:hypothetical protein
LPNWKYRAVRKLKRTLKKYSLYTLLARQPKTLRKNRRYAEMIQHLRTSEKLPKLRIGRRCYSLLDRAVIKPEHLENFYSTYRLPRDPFFPLFFSIKREYLSRRAGLEKARQKYINSRIKKLPGEIKKIFRQLAGYETKLHRSGLYPVWKKYFMPRTKKLADEFSSWTTAGWLQYFSAYFSELSKTYEKASASRNERMIASWLLDVPEHNPPVALVKKQYRILSKSCHPDQGGSNESFRLLAWAKEILTGDT